MLLLNRPWARYNSTRQDF